MHGQPLAIFISDFGFRKELLMGSGWKVSTICLVDELEGDLSSCVNGHWRMLSNSPRITTNRLPKMRNHRVHRGYTLCAIV